MKLLKITGPALAVIASVACCLTASARRDSELLFVASKSKGLCVYQMDTGTGAITTNEATSNVMNPQFIAIHPSKKFLFTVNTAMISGKKAGAVSSFAIESHTGKLTFLNQQPSPGGSTHLAVDNAGRNIIVVNYGAGSVAVFPIAKDGTLAPMSSFSQHHGSSVHPQRQTGPHSHGVSTDREDHFAFVSDLGLDKVLIYPFDSATGTLATNKMTSANLKPGAGPRHLALSPDGKNLYVVNELDSTMTAFNYDSRSGHLEQIQTLSTLPSDFVGKNAPAEIAVHPSGRFVYASNRGHDSIAVFDRDQKSGHLTIAAVQSTDGKTPRHFEVDPTGKFLLAANQDSNSITFFRIDEKSGKLTRIPTTIEMDGPACVKCLLEN